MAEHKFSKSPPRVSGKMTRRYENSPPSPLSNSYDSEAERMIEQQRMEKRAQYNEILHYQIKEKEIQKQLMRKDSGGVNMFARGIYLLHNLV